MTNSIREIAESTLDKVLKRGAEEADILIYQSKQASVDVRNSAMEMVQNSTEISLGLRVILDNRKAYISSSDFSPEIMDTTVHKVMDMVKVAPQDPNVGLAEKHQLESNIPNENLQQFDDTPFPIMHEMESFGLEMEKAALSVEGVSNVSSSSMQYGSTQSIIMATNGFVNETQVNYRGAGCSAIAGEGLGMQTDYYYQQRVFASDLETPGFIGNKAGERAAKKLNPIKPNTMECSIIFDQRIASSLISHLLSAINGQAIARGSSWLLEYLGKKVLPSGIDLIEEPHRLKSLASKYFDDEGIPTNRKRIVENGILKTWILDLTTARKLNLNTSGNASRGLTSGPSPSITNVSMTLGERSKEEMIKSIKKGILIDSLIGSTINQNTGDYSRGASGVLIENGELTKPVTEFTVAGNLKSMLASIIPANDPEEFKSLRIPTLLVENMTVAGK